MYVAEQGGGILVAAMGCLREVEPVRLRADDGAGDAVLVPAERHVVDVGAQALVQLTGERETARLRHRSREDGRDHDAPASIGQSCERAAGGEHGIVEMRRESEDDAARHLGAQRRCGAAR